MNPVHGVFVGELKNGQKSGYGKEVWKNGQVYSGSFENGLKNGFGRFKFSARSSFDQFEGQVIML